MPLILNIETSSPVCSVCLARDGKFILGRDDFSGINHASLLTVFIQQIFAETKLEMSQLDVIAVSAGPGSYTGTRIGVVTAKGLCFALNKPLVAVDSLQALAFGIEKKSRENNSLYCAAIDARRDEIYFGLYDGEGNEIVSSRNTTLTTSLPFVVPRDQELVVGGSGAEKCRHFWKSTQIIFDNSITASAGNMIPFSEKKVLLSDFEEIVSFEPHYTKPVYITRPRLLII